MASTFIPSTDPLENIREIRTSVSILITLASAGELSREDALSASETITAELDALKMHLLKQLHPHAKVLPVLTLGEVAARAKARPTLTAIDGGAK